MKKKSASVRLSLKIFRNIFYDQLPEDEQVAVEVLQAIDDVYVSENAEFGEGLIEEYFNQTLLQTEYSVNDLLIFIFIFFYQMLLVLNETMTF